MDYQDRLHDKLPQIAEICRRHGVRELALFGSALRPDFHADSDFDFLVEFLPESKIGLFEYIHMENELAELLERKVDLVSKRGLKPRIREGVLSQARPSMRRDDERLRDILEHIDSAVLAIASKGRPEFDIDPVLQKAVQYDLFIIGEAAANISKDLRTKHPQVPWKDICGLRTKLAHEYFSLDLDVIWRTATDDLPVLRAQIAQILKAEFPDQNPA